jgi:hypothetical protein
MSDSGPQVSQVSSDVNESGFLQRIGRRAVEHAAPMSRPGVIK